MNYYQEAILLGKENNCKVLDKKITHYEQLIEIECECGNIFVKKYKNFKNSPRCLSCVRKKKLNRNRYTFEEVKNFIESKNAKLLDSRYIKCSAPLQIICNCGKQYTTSFQSFKLCHNCIDCGNLKLRKMKQFKYEDVKLYFEKQNCKLISKEYINCDSHLEYLCSCGEKSKITFYKFKTGQRCKKCSVLKRSGINHHTWNEDREYVQRVKFWQKKNNSMIRHICRDFDIKKKAKSHKLLGYSTKEFREYIEAHENYQYTIDVVSQTGDKFSIDHIFPVDAFVQYNLDKEENISVVNCLENLRPLPLKENTAKSNKYDKEKFENWLTLKNVNFVSKLCKS